MSKRFTGPVVTKNGLLNLGVAAVLVALAVAVGVNYPEAMTDETTSEVSNGMRR